MCNLEWLSVCAVWCVAGFRPDLGSVAFRYRLVKDEFQQIPDG